MGDNVTTRRTNVLGGGSWSPLAWGLGRKRVSHLGSLESGGAAIDDSSLARGPLDRGPALHDANVCVPCSLFASKNEESAEGGHTGRYPETVLYFDIQKAKKGERGAGTRRPEMVDFFINTYTNVGDKVLDITCYNAITGERCAVLDREYVD
eukprot:SAG22_NODE_2540_length_2463_cov_5.358714_3_plen_152_part_00